MIADNNNVSFEMIRKSRARVINVPAADLVDKVVGIGEPSVVHAQKGLKLCPFPGVSFVDPLKAVVTTSG